MLGRFGVAVALAPLALALLLTAGASAAARPDLSTDRDRYRMGQQQVRITLRNTTDERLRLARRWRIKELGSGKVVARLRLSKRRRTLRPGGRRVWRWDQTRGGFRLRAPSLWRGGAVGPGRFTVIAKTSAGRLVEPFQIGKYFTLDFRILGIPELDNEFTLFSRELKPIRQMERQARLPAAERDLIVSGIVRPGARYNPNWSYTMGPGSIVLGEAFIEVCDASPWYVERNVRSWMGERWCPWTSYVERVGR